ncbi:MAG: glycosyltransferase [Actinomycetes bacterium]
MPALSKSDSGGGSGRLDLMVVSYSNVVDVPRGAERYAWGEAEALAQLINVAFVSSSRPAVAPFEQIQLGGWTRRWYQLFGRRNPITLAFFHLISLFNPVVFVQALVLFRRRRPKAVHTHSLVALSPAIWLAARLAGARVLHTHQGFWLLCERTNLTGKNGKPCHERQTTCLLCRSLRPPKRLQLSLVTDEVFASVWVRQRLARAGNVMPSFATGTLAPAPAEPVIDGPVVFIGELSLHKGILVLLEAFTRAADRLSLGATLVIGGSGPLDEHVAAAAAADPRVTWAGELGPDERDRLLRQASLLVIPSTWPENSPLVFFEALAAGLPVIATSGGGMTEFAQYGNTEFVAPDDPDALAATLVAVLGDSERLRKLAQAARANRSEAMPERFARQMLDLLDSD